MPDSEPKNALIGLLSYEIEYPTRQSQRSWAAKRRTAAALIFQSLGGGFGALGRGSNYSFEMNLIRFAEKKQIDLSKDDWRDNAIYRAAMEHPHLQPGYRPRGRPKRIGNALGLLAFGGGTEEQRNIIQNVEKIKEELADLEKKYPMSDSKAAYWYTIFDYLNERKRQSLAIPKWESDELNEFIASPEFMDLHSAKKMKISRARKAVTRKSG